MRITNRSRSRREIEVTSYAEVVIAPPATDALHPAFSNLFSYTEILPERGAIQCTRRPRSVGERAPWMLHLMVGMARRAARCPSKPIAHASSVEREARSRRRR